MDPFFIYFVSRSGSTFLANMLAKKFTCCVLPESNFVTRLIRQYGVGGRIARSDSESICDYLYAEDKFHDLGILRGDLQSRIDNAGIRKTRDLILIINFLAADRMGQGEEPVGLKKGSYIRHHRAIRRMFPDARFVLLHRDGRAVFNSQRSSIYSQTGKPFETDAAQAARQWSNYIRQSRRIAKTCGSAALSLSYESLIERTDNALVSVAGFLKLDRREEDQTSTAYQVAERYGDLHRNIESDPLVGRASAWKNELTEEQVRVFERVAGNELVDSGYPLVFNSSVSRSFWRRGLFR